MKKMVLVVVTACITTTCLYAQEITRIGRATLNVNAASEDQFDYYDQGADKSFNICWFSFNYPSTGGDGQPVTLSALACMPVAREDGAEINNVVAGCHITITANKDCPTQFNLSGSMFSDNFFNMILSSTILGAQDDLARHNLVILPDYEGYGITKASTHPYLCGETTARQVADALHYGIQLYKNDSKTEDIRRPFRQDWRTICTGYSQGGAVAMATHRFIEEQGLSEEFHLAGSLCGDGPYSPLVTVLYYFELDRKDVAMSMPIVFPLMLKGLCDYDEAMANHKIGDYLNERFLETGVLDMIAEKEKTIDEITDVWKQLYINGKNGDIDYYKSVLTGNGKLMLKNILKPEVYDYFCQLLDQYPDYSISDIPLPEQGTAAADLHIALEHNNLTKGWLPTHPVFLYHSTGDEVVPYDNYLCAANLFGEQATLYPSPLNGTHVGTGQEFFMLNDRIEALRLLVSAGNNSNGIRSTSTQDTTPQKWYDLSGRPIIGQPTSKGIYISGGKKRVFY